MQKEAFPMPTNWKLVACAKEAKRRGMLYSDLMTVLGVNPYEYQQVLEQFKKDYQEERRAEMEKIRREEKKRKAALRRSQKVGEMI